MLRIKSHVNKSNTNYTWLHEYALNFALCPGSATVPGKQTMVLVSDRTDSCKDARGNFEQKEAQTFKG